MIRLWDWPSGGKAPKEGELLRGHTDAVTGLNVTGDGDRLRSVSKDGTIRNWALTTDELLKQSDAILDRAAD